jgi:translation initiation factor IF-3
MSHAEIGRGILDRVAAALEDIGVVESPPRIEGRHMIMLLSPKAGAVKAVKKKSAEAPAKEPEAS